MKKKIYIVAVTGGWGIFSGNGERISGIYGSPNQAMEIARPLAVSLGAEIVIYLKEQSYNTMRIERRLRKRKENAADVQ